LPPLKKQKNVRPNLRSLVQRLLELIRGSAEKQDLRLRQEYEVTIGSIILKEEAPAERFVNHLWYTIIDQRRDVKDFVIPMMATLMFSGFNPDFACDEPNEALELLTSVLTAYGHELKYSSQDNEALLRDGYYNKKTSSRSESILKTLISIKNNYGRPDRPWQRFKEYVLKHRSLIIRDRKFAERLVKDWPFINSKSFRFFLRDIEPILSDPNAIPIPVDSNVAQSIQKTGLMFDQWPPNPSEVIPVSRRGEKIFERRITQRIKNLSAWNCEECGICSECNKNSCHARRIVYLAQALFLLGSEYCQRCCANGKFEIVPCPLTRKCMLSLYLEHPMISIFIRRLEGRI